MHSYNDSQLYSAHSGVDPGGGGEGGDRPPPIKKHRGESIFSPPQSVYKVQTGT